MTKEERFLLPDEAVPYILLQRTETQTSLRELRYLLPYGRALYNQIYNKYLYKLDAQLRSDEIKDQYLHYLRDEYENLKPYLPENVDKLLNIGCGVGGMNVFFAQHYLDDGPEFYLFDKSKVSSNVYYQFSEDAAFYNSLEVAGEVLELNGVSPNTINLMNADKRDLDEIPNVDLCVSLLSWGFHYPVETYLKKVGSLLKDDGELIIDLRQGTDGLKDCNEVFREHEIIEDTEKYKRIVFRGPISSSEKQEKKLAESST